MSRSEDKTYLAESERELVVRLVADRLVWRELEEAVRLHADRVREEGATGKRGVLDDCVRRVVGVLGVRDEDVPDLVDERRRDDGRDVMVKVRLGEPSEPKRRS
jgi:hypothetical protein